MPQADLPYIIGVIREKEKELLEEDEYTRVVAAPTPAEAWHALADTAYGIHLAQHPGDLGAVAERLVAEFQWLTEMLGETHPLLVFMAARYDALHVATAVIDAKRQRTAVHSRSLGTISDELLVSCLAHHTGWESVPAPWREFLRREQQRLAAPGWTKTGVIERVQARMFRVMTAHATTPLTREITALLQERLIREAGIRPHQLPADLIGYERDWDVTLLALLKAYRAEPVQADAIVAWWYALSLEVKTVRLILSAISSGFTGTTLEQLRRPLYRVLV